MKLVNFALIGVVNTAIDFAVFLLAFMVAGLPLIASNVAAWLVAVTGSYVMNTMITFRSETGRVLKPAQFLGFAVAGILGVIMTTTTLVVLSHYVHVIAAKVVATLVGFGVNFVMSNFFVFRSRLPAK